VLLGELPPPASSSDAAIAGTDSSSGRPIPSHPRSLSELSAVTFPVIRLASSISAVRRRRSAPTWMTPTAPRPNSAPVSQADRSVRRAALVRARVTAGP
jgi:hypothetical protein